MSSYFARDGSNFCHSRSLVVERRLWTVGVADFGGIAAIVAVVKPLLLLTKKIKDFEGVVMGYRALEFDLMEIKSNVEQKRKYDVSMQTEFRKALQREKVLVGKTPESREKMDVKAKCEEEVRKELPDECFFIPEDNDDKQANSAATPATPAAVAPR